jgi:hypothetical protein
MVKLTLYILTFLVSSATVICLAKEALMTAQAKTKRRWLFARKRVCGRLRWKPQDNLLEVLFKARDDETWDHPGRRGGFWEEVFEGVIAVKEGGREWPVDELLKAIMANNEEPDCAGYVKIVFSIDTQQMRGVPCWCIDQLYPRLLLVFEDGEEWQAA